jgi:conjugative relaxase-like TrwC/TraI family protein
VLRINQQTSAAAAKSYHGSPAEAGYYRDGEQEMVGAWGGKAAERLDLHGEVLQHHFERLCDNRHPFTGERLTARMRANRRVGYDFTFDVCKSVSILYGIDADPAILDAFRWAIRATMEEMEKGVGARVRKRGQMFERIVANMAWAEHLHFTARPVKGTIDPHLHAHCFVLNVCWDQVEKVWKAIDVASLKKNAPHWQTVFQQRFGRHLAELGYSVVWNRSGDNFEIAGVNRDLIDRFSRRTAHIELVADRRGITDPAAKAELGAATRERKQKDATLPQLRAEWRQRLTDDDRAALNAAALKRRHFVPRPATSSMPQASAFRLTTGDREQWDHDRRLQRQRIAAHEHARASYSLPSPAPPPRQNHRLGHAR